MDDYIVLGKDTFDSVVKLTGKSKDEVEFMLAESIITGVTQIFWRIGDRYFQLGVSMNYIAAGMLNDIMKKAIEGSRREYAANL